GGVAHDVVADNPVLPAAGAEGAQLRPVGPGGAALEDETLDLNIVLAAAMRGEDAVTGRDLNGAGRGSGVVAEMDEQLLAIIASQPTVRRLAELLPRGHLGQRLVIEEDHRITLAIHFGFFLARRLWRSDKGIAEDKRLLGQRRTEDAGRIGRRLPPGIEDVGAANDGGMRRHRAIQNWRFVVPPARGGDPFVVDARASVDYITGLGQLGGGIDSAKRVIGLAWTFIADRSRNRAIFGFACGSTALLCPL